MQADVAAHEIEAPAKRNSMICPCCLQFVEGAAFLADPATCQITNGTRTVKLTRKQFGLAQFLINTYPQVSKKDSIYDQVFMRPDGSGPDMKIVDVLVCQIRPLLAEVGLVIETVWGTGYRLVETDMTNANTIKDTSIRLRDKGSMNRWKPEYDEQLLDLIRRKNSPTMCATIMRLPYMTVERHYKRLQALV
jgi:DNA-binding winged helix-turn-helix (wHTH) protein